MAQGQGAAAPRRVSVWMPVALGVVILGLVVALVVGRGADGGDGTAAAEPTSPTSPATPQPATPSPTADAEPTTVPELARRLEGDVMAVGAVDAPVVLVEYADYRCPFCAKFGRETLPTILEEYVESGEVRVEWRDMPIFGAESELVAVAGRAAGNQERFWQFQTVVFDAAPESGHPDLPRDVLVELAREAGVADLALFEQDLDDPALLAAVRADAAEGQAVGVTSVPAFVVGGTPFLGAQPIEVFREVIESELAAVG